MFFQREENDDYWTVFCPKKTPELNYIYGEEFNKKYIEYEQYFLSHDEMKPYYKRYKAKELLDHIINCQIQSGMPYMLNGDAVNHKSNQKNLGYIGGSNLCLEIMEYSDEDNISSCNLASISMKSFVKGRTGVLLNDYDWKKQGLIGRSLVRNLNQVIDNTTAPVIEVKNCNLSDRPMAIGVSGMAEALYDMDLHFEHGLATEFNKMFFASLYFNCIAQSIIEAIYYGPYDTFQGSPISEGKFQFDLWADEFKILKHNDLLGETPLRTEKDDEPLHPSEWNQKPVYLYNNLNELIDIIQPTWEDIKRCIMKYGLRNSLLIALMPSATTANIMRNSETTEAPMTNLYDRRLMNGNYPILDRYLEADAREIGVWNKYTLDLIGADYGSISKLDKLIIKYPEWYPNFNKNDPKSWERLRYIQLKYKTMWELGTKRFLYLSAERARYICQSQSFNAYIKEPNHKKLRAFHHTGRKLGVKTGMYYLREEPPRRASKITIDAKILQFIEELNPQSITNMTTNVNEIKNENNIENKIEPKLMVEQAILPNLKYIEQHINKYKNNEMIYYHLNELKKIIDDIKNKDSKDIKEESGRWDCGEDICFGCH